MRHSEVVLKVFDQCKLYLCSRSRQSCASVMVMLSPCEESRRWTQQGGLRQGLAALQNTAWGEMATQQWREPEPAVIPHAYHHERDCRPRGATVWIQRWKEQRTGDPHLSTEPLPCQLACWGCSRCMVSGQACTEETRALHSAHARLPGCPAECTGLRSRWAAHGISVLSSEAWGSSRKTAGTAASKNCCKESKHTGLFFLYRELANTQRPEGTVSALSCHAAGCKRLFKKMNFSSLLYVSPHSNLKGKQSEGFLVFYTVLRSAYIKKQIPREKAEGFWHACSLS